MDKSCDLSRKRCEPCEGKVGPLPPEQAQTLLAQVPAWKIVANGQRIRREWRMKDFPAALDFFRRVGEVAEMEDHHPDLHLVEYRKLAIELWTHAANGLTENDFILAAKINELPVELKA
jgi:4a-hydroxytetrahydrobiopterin dehydratase